MGVFSRISFEECAHKSPHEIGYIRTYRTMFSGAILLLIEQLVVLNRRDQVQRMLRYIQKHNPNKPLDIVNHRLAVLSLRSLVGKLRAGLSTQKTLDLFFKTFRTFEDCYSHVMALFGMSIFQKAGFKITTKTYQNQYQPVSIGTGQELLLIEDEFQCYGFIQCHVLDPYEPDIVLHSCSICGLKKPDLLNNVFCQHRFCNHCIQVYIKMQTQPCPKTGCNAKVICRLLKLSAEKRRKSVVLQITEIKMDLPKPRPKTPQMIPDDWPPIFKGTHIPSYIEEQHIILREILFGQRQPKVVPTVEEQLELEYCGSCFMSTQSTLKCNRKLHPRCVQCTSDCQLCKQ